MYRLDRLLVSIVLMPRGKKKRFVVRAKRIAMQE
jgi:hypothetical protein